ncbi:MAG: TonB-dependent receptor, partial [Gammaproteobacteria bacterium]
WIAPQVFYKHIDGYIQGVPSQDPVANAVATMMTGRSALEFANTDAKLYGLDAAWGVYLTDTLTLEGVLGVVRGRRTDVDDHLYRIAPPNARLALTHDAERWSATVESVLYAAQTRTSAYNDEGPTPGYGVLNAAATWRFREGLALHARVSNLLDKRYRDHLGGINRATNSDVPIGERLFGPGRTFQVGIDVSW